ncbi:MAG: hypothetical protein WBF71_14265 [Microthrixaceae bacterium]
MLCPRHHRMHHKGLLGITGNPDLPDGHPDGLRFTNQHGIPIEATGQPKPPRPDDFPAYEPYTSPTGERLQKRWVHFNKTDAEAPKPGPRDADRPRFDPAMPDLREPDQARQDRPNRQPAA